MKSEAKRVLIVDDEAVIRDLFANALRRQGYEVDAVATAREALRQAQGGGYAAVVSDIRLPGMDGLTLCAHIRTTSPEVPIILVTGYADLATARQAVRFGVFDYLEKPVDPAELALVVARACECSAVSVATKDSQHELERRIEAEEYELAETLHRTEAALEELERTHSASSRILAGASEVDHEFSGRHLQRTSAYAELLAKALGRPDDFVLELARSSPLHDLGKLRVPGHLLSRPGKLSPEEMDLIKLHTIEGEDMLADIPGLEMARVIARSHHEWFDGEGYPDRKQGEAIPLEARLVAVVDCFDALCSDRPHRPGLPVEQAFELIASGAGSHFSPPVAEAFREHRDEVLEIRHRLPDPGRAHAD